MHWLTKAFVLAAAVLAVLLSALTIAYSSNADKIVGDYYDEQARRTSAEAMASGLPVVSADCPYGPAALIDSGVNGILAKSEDPNDLAEKLWTMISHEKLRIDFGKKAMEIKERLDLHLISKKWIIFFEELIGEHKEVRQSKIA